jgi:hypothetical protein
MGEEILSVFDPQNPEFVRISEKSLEKDSRAMYGPEFLVWVSEAEEFATFFMGTKTMRREAPAVKTFLEKAAVLKPGKISNSKYTWYSPKVEACTTPFELPEEEEIIAQYTKFMNPPKKILERVKEEEVATSRAR